MSLHNYLKGGASNPKAPGKDQSWAGANAGPYLGVVKGNKDPTRMGRLSVLIPSLAQASPNAGTESQLITCEYLSPFYGAKGVKHNIPGSTEYEHSQHSYGFWAVPPDLETTVLVIFAEGKMNQAFWIGCVQDPYTNHMTPGIASSEKTWDKTDGGPAGQLSSGVDKQATYGSTNVPAGELNRAATGALPKNDYEAYPKPIHPLAETLLKQGLSADDVRGNTSSSARRESPSQVFGISTPGRKDTASVKQPVGAKDSGATDHVSRKIGHTFVMDDGAVDGTNQLTRLRTASGHQLLMHDTAGVVYIANGSGNAYIEMQSNGRIDVYSGVGGINLRTEGDFNLHSDSNINMHANGQIRMSAAKEMIQSADAILKIGEKGILQSSPSGGIQSYAKSAISSFTPGSQLHGATGVFHVQGSQVHLNAPMGRPGSGGGGITQWGPTWLTQEKAGMQLREEGDVELAQKGISPLKAFTGKTKTTVHRFVTHEPMFRASVIAGDSIIPDTPADKKKWLERANTPGTPEFLNMKNRLSDNPHIRFAQSQEDQLGFLKKAMGTSTNAEKAKKLLTEYTSGYDKLYGIAEQVNLPFDIKDSISNKFKGFNVNSDVKDLTNTLTSQVIDKFSGKSTELFKDNVFVNSAGELFTLGSKTMEGIGGGFDLANSSLNAVKGLKGNLSAGNIPATIANLSSITQNYQSIIGGNIVGINSIQSLATKAGLFNASAAQLGGQSFLQNVGQNLGLKLGSLGSSIKSVFSGFKFSDSRLKEEIKLVGKSPLGINIYSFKYKQSEGTYEGVMAQEVPWAREMTDTGYYIVDYSKVDVEFRRLN